MLLRNDCIMYGRYVISCCEMYAHFIVAAIYAVAKLIYTVRLMRYMPWQNVCTLYGSCGIWCSEMYVYCTVAAA